MNIFRVLYWPTTKIVDNFLEVPATSTTFDKDLLQFDKPTRAEALAEITARGLLYFETPGAKQLHLYQQFAAAYPEQAAPFAKLIGPITELNTAAVKVVKGKTIADYSLAKAALQTVAIDPTKPEQVVLKSELLACYAS